MFRCVIDSLPVFSNHVNQGGRYDELMVSIDTGFRIERAGFEIGRGHCVVFLGKVLYLYSLYPCVLMGTEELLLGGNPAMDKHPIQGGVEILLVASYHRNWDKLWPVWDTRLDADLTLPC